MMSGKSKMSVDGLVFAGLGIFGLHTHTSFSLGSLLMAVRQGAWRLFVKVLDGCPSWLYGCPSRFFIAVRQGAWRMSVKMIWRLSVKVLEVLSVKVLDGCPSTDIFAGSSRRAFFAITPTYYLNQNSPLFSLRVLVSSFGCILRPRPPAFSSSSGLNFEGTLKYKTIWAFSTRRCNSWYTRWMM